MLHEYGHLLVDRFRPGIDYLTVPGRKPINERFAEAFGLCFLMPAAHYLRCDIVSAREIVTNTLSSREIATDDRKAIRIGQHAGLTVLSSPQLVKMWADNAHPDQPTLVKALKDIELLAQFRPNSSMPECQWWLDQTVS